MVSVKAVSRIFLAIIVSNLMLLSIAQASEHLRAVPNGYKDEGIVMHLQGMGTKRVFFLKAFTASLYQEDTSNKDLLSDVPKHLDVKYFVDIPAKKLNAFTIEQMKQNINSQEFNALFDEIDLMGQYFADLKKGDRFALTYISGIGTKFTHNGTLRGIIKGSHFAKALFSVWLGEKPFDQKLKNEILGKQNV